MFMLEMSMKEAQTPSDPPSLTRTETDLRKAKSMLCSFEAFVCCRASSKSSDRRSRSSFLNGAALAVDIRFRTFFLTKKTTSTIVYVVTNSPPKRIGSKLGNPDALMEQQVVSASPGSPEMVSLGRTSPKNIPPDQEVPVSRIALES